MTNYRDRNLVQPIVSEIVEDIDTVYGENAMFNPLRNGYFLEDDADWSPNGTIDAEENEWDLNLAAFTGTNLSGTYATVPKTGERWGYEFTISKYTSGTFTLRSRNAVQTVLNGVTPVAGQTFRGEFTASGNWNEWQFIASGSGFVASLKNIRFIKLS